MVRSLPTLLLSLLLCYFIFAHAAEEERLSLFKSKSKSKTKSKESLRAVNDDALEERKGENTLRDDILVERVTQEEYGKFQELCPLAPRMLINDDEDSSDGGPVGDDSQSDNTNIDDSQSGNTNVKMVKKGVTFEEVSKLGDDMDPRKLLEAGRDMPQACGAGRDMHRPHPKDLSTYKKVRFLVMGDQGTGKAAQYAVAAAMFDTCPPRQDEDGTGCDFVIGMGDNIYQNGASSLADPQFTTKFEKAYERFGDFDFWMSIGNHDHGSTFGGGRIAVHWIGNNRWDYYQVRYGQTCNKRWRMPGQYYGLPKLPNFISGMALDTHRFSFKQGLQLYHHMCVTDKDAKWKFIFGHHPLYNFGTAHGTCGYGASNGAPGSELALKQSYKSWRKDVMTPLIKACGINTAFFGHDHHFEHITKVYDPKEQPDVDHLNLFLIGNSAKNDPSSHMICQKCETFEKKCGEHQPWNEDEEDPGKSPRPIQRYDGQKPASGYYPQNLSMSLRDSHAKPVFDSDIRPRKSDKRESSWGFAVVEADKDNMLVKYYRVSVAHPDGTATLETDFDDFVQQADYTTELSYQWVSRQDVAHGPTNLVKQWKDDYTEKGQTWLGVDGGDSF